MILLLFTVLAAAAAVAWRAPWAAIGFVINGSVIYYAALDLIDVAPSALLTGAILAVPAGVAMVRLLLRPGAAFQAARNPSFYLFFVFVLIWYARWLIDPAPTTGLGGRALAYMLVLAIIPFVAGLSVRKSEVREAIWWLLGFGVAGVAVMVGYWNSGAPTLSTNLSGRWEPIPYLPGGVIAIDLGVACLSLFALFPTSRVLAAVLGCGLAFLVFAVDIRVGSRGPFLFLMVCLVGYIAVVIRRRGLRHAAIRAAGLIAALVLAFGLAGPLSTVANGQPRVAEAGSYFSGQDPSTRERLETFEAALAFIAQKPIFGWGGGLVGRDINGHAWDYAHNTLLDPLVETGVVGAVPYWTLFVLVAVWIVSAFRQKLPIAETMWPLLPLFAFALLDSLISGYVANSRHLWLFTGIVCSLYARAGEIDAALVVPGSERGAATTHA